MHKQQLSTLISHPIHGAKAKIHELARKPEARQHFSNHDVQQRLVACTAALSKAEELIDKYGDYHNASEKMLMAKRLFSMLCNALWQASHLHFDETPEAKEIIHCLQSAHETIENMRKAA